MGKVMMSGVAPNMKVPISGIPASELAVGSVVKLMEGGVATEYLVVNQGIPSGSSLYDASCDGTWLLRKEVCAGERQWNNANINDYENSTIHAYLNNEIYNSYGSIEQSAIKQVKIPYRAGEGTSTTVTSGVNGLSAKVFLLSATELNWASTTGFTCAEEGSCLSYFEGCEETDSKRIAKDSSGYACTWWLRSPYCWESYGSKEALSVNYQGYHNSGNCTLEFYVRPSLIIPFNTIFDKSTLILKGVA